MVDKKVRVSDLSESLADRRVTWALGSKRYVMDMTDDEYAKFEAVLEPYLKASRTPPRRKARKAAGS